METVNNAVLANELNHLILAAHSVDYRGSYPRSAVDDFEKLMNFCNSSPEFKALPEDEKEDFLFGLDAIRDILDDLTIFRKRVPKQIEITEVSYQAK